MNCLSMFRDTLEHKVHVGVSNVVTVGDMIVNVEMVDTGIQGIMILIDRMRIMELICLLFVSH